MIRQNVPLSCPSGVEINIKKKKIVRLLNLEDMQKEEKRWGENLSLGREWLREKVQEAKSSGVDLVYRNHFERDAEGNRVFPQSSCSRLWSVQLLPNSLPVRALVSFPGSGNTHPSQPPCQHYRYQHHHCGRSASLLYFIRS